MVVIFLGSKSDLDWGKEIGKQLTFLGIPYRMHVASAHKTPVHLLALIKQYEKATDPLVYICVAGRSNALGGFVDAQTLSVVINCPPESEKYAGMDILSSLRMPKGVACLTILEPEQAALAAAKILSNFDKKLKEKIFSYQKKLKEKIVRDDQALNLNH